MSTGQEIIAKIWGDVLKNDRRIERDAAKENPSAYKLSKVFEGSTHYYYYETKNGRGSRVRFCYTVERNVAGYFLTWREIETHNHVRRDDFEAFKSKRKATKCARDKYNAMKGGKQ